MATDCIFCKIISGDIAAERIYEDDYFLAFLDVNPVVEGHILLIPKKHCETIYDLGEGEVEKIGEAIQTVSNKLKSIFGPNINIVNTSGKYASQSILHFHFHLIPRRSGDRLWDGEKSRIILDRSSGFERIKPTKEQLKKLAEEIKSN
ncbi:MAG: HIT domain-containing protein [Candidatus Aenigmatarchaeota archaeon]